jgi:sugar phosphate isomerase/epimerase
MTMPSNPHLARRQFIKAGATLGALALAGRAFAQPADPFRGLKFGVASYSFRRFTLEQALAMTRELGLRYISLKDFHLPMNSTREQRQAVSRQVAQAGLTLLGGGVIYLGVDETEIRHAFEYARDASMPTMVCSPAPAAMDLMEKYARQYDIRVALHNHGPGDRNYPLPLDAFRLVENRDARLGVCVDVGHTIRAGGDPVAAIRRCAPRLYDLHLKDVSLAEPRGQNVVVGQGVISIPQVLSALLEIKFAGHVGLEFEATPDDPLPGMKQSVEYVRQVLARG